MSGTNFNLKEVAMKKYMKPKVVGSSNVHPG
jgi:hypothetical protein